jgi:hypothetical protein
LLPLHLQLSTCHSLRTVQQHNRGRWEFVTANTGGRYDAPGNVSEHPIKFGNIPNSFSTVRLRSQSTWPFALYETNLHLVLRS